MNNTEELKDFYDTCVRVEGMQDFEILKDNEVKMLKNSLAFETYRLRKAWGAFKIALKLSLYSTLSVFR